MTPRAAFLLLAAAWPASALHAAEPSQDAMEVEVDGTIEVGVDGAVREARLAPGLPEALATLAGEAIRKWRFVPVEIEGRAVPVTTRIQVDLLAEPVPGGYQLRVADVDLGVPRKRGHGPPRYPPDALRSGVGAEVELLLQIDALGNVEDVHVEQVSLTDEQGKRANAHRERFAAASVAAARDWTFEMTEFVDGAPVPVTMRIPVTFELTGGFVTGSDFIEGPVHPAPWPDRKTLGFVEDPVGTRL